MTLWKSKREQRWWKNPKMVEESKDGGRIQRCGKSHSRV